MKEASRRRFDWPLATVVCLALAIGATWLSDLGGASGAVWPRLGLYFGCALGLWWLASRWRDAHRPGSRERDGRSLPPRRTGRSGRG